MISFGRNREVNIIKKAFRYIMHANVAANSGSAVKVDDCSARERLSCLDERKGQGPSDSVFCHWIEGLASACQKGRRGKLAGRGRGPFTARRRLFPAQLLSSRSLLLPALCWVRRGGVQGSAVSPEPHCCWWWSSGQGHGN